MAVSELLQMSVETYLLERYGRAAYNFTDRAIHGESHPDEFLDDLGGHLS